MLADCLRRWLSINPALVERVVFGLFLANTRRRPIVDLLLAHRLRRWHNSKPKLGRRLIFACFLPLIWSSVHSCIMAHQMAHYSWSSDHSCMTRAHQVAHWASIQVCHHLSYSSLTLVTALHGTCIHSLVLSIPVQLYHGYQPAHLLTDSPTHTDPMFRGLLCLIQYLLI